MATLPGGRRVDVRSAGSEPADQINPSAVAAMAWVGIDITDGVPKLLDHDTAYAADVIITMGCGDGRSRSPLIDRAATLQLDEGDFYNPVCGRRQPVGCTDGADMIGPGQNCVSTPP